MVNAIKKSFLEKKVKKFFDCGWKLKGLKKEKDYLFISPGGNVYSAKDVSKEDLYSLYDYSTLKERDDATRFCNLLLENLHMLRTYRKYIEYV